MPLTSQQQTPTNTSPQAPASFRGLFREAVYEDGKPYQREDDLSDDA